MKANFLNFGQQLVSSAFFNSIIFSIILLGCYRNFILQNTHLLQHQTGEDIARLVHDVDKIKNS